MSRAVRRLRRHLKTSEEFQCLLEPSRGSKQTTPFCLLSKPTDPEVDVALSSAENELSWGESAAARRGDQTSRS